MNLYNVEVDGIDSRDAPDYADAYITYAEHLDGTPLTDEELNNVPDDEVYEAIVNCLY